MTTSTNYPAATHRISDDAVDINGEPSIFRGLLATLTEIDGGRVAARVLAVHASIEEVIRLDQAAAEAASDETFLPFAVCNRAGVAEVYGIDEATGLALFWGSNDDSVPLDEIETVSFDDLFDIVDRSFSTRALAHALGAEPCPLELSCILDRLTLAELSELVENRHDPSFVLSYGAAS